MPGKPPVGRKGIGWDRSLPKAKLNDVQHDGKIFHGSYDGDCFTLSPSQTHTEFYSEVSRINDTISRLAAMRATYEERRRQKGTQ